MRSSGWPWRPGATAREAIGLLGAITLGLLLIALVYQIPATHAVDIGGYDEAYVQGFYDPERADAPILAGSDGSARWTRDVSYLLFPQAGLPALVMLRLRGRPGAAATEVAVLLNGARELGRFHIGAAWEEHTFAIDGGLLKPHDVVIEIRAPAAPPSADDPRPAGVLLDRATYRTGAPPIAPYPAQLAYGALAAGMLYTLTKNREPRTENQEPRIEDRSGKLADSRSSIFYPRSSIFHVPFVIGLLIVSIAFLVLYRLQPPYPYPLRRLLPIIDVALAGLLALRYGPVAVRRAPALLDAAALGAIGAWTIAILLAARDHVALALPGVENDFGVFARRSAQLAGRLLPGGVYSSADDGVLRADGFYNQGYPLLLWLTRPLAQGNPFLAARLIAVASGALLLIAAWWLARRLLGRGPALLVLLILALSPLVAEYGLYLGTDMPFAALCTLALALLIPTKDEGRRTKEIQRIEDRGSRIDRTRSSVGGRWSVVGGRWSVVVLAGLTAGAAFLVRHPGLLLLPFGWLVIWQSSDLSALSSEVDSADEQLKPQTSNLKTQHLIVFTLAFVLAIAPQLFVNIRDTGQPLYSQQAKNIWLCVYGSCDWGRWDEAPNSVTLSEVLLRAPGRFLAHWWANVRGFFGAGGEDTSEFGHAIQLRLLGFPANWLALGGLLAWLVRRFRNHQDTKTQRYEGEAEVVASAHPLTPSPAHPFTLLLVWLALYVLTVSIGISLPRFFLPLAPVYAIAAAWTIGLIEPRTENREPAQEQRTELALERSEGNNEQEHASNVLRFTFYVLRHAQLLAAMLLLALLWGGFAAGAGYVLSSQDSGEAAAARLVQETLRPSERLVVRAPPRVLLGKYSAIAHMVVHAGGQYLLALGGEAPAGGTAVGTAGEYTLYRIAP